MTKSKSRVRVFCVAAGLGLALAFTAGAALAYDMQDYYNAQAQVAADAASISSLQSDANDFQTQIQQKK